MQHVLQRVVDQYPSLKTSVLEVERARQEAKKVAAQLGWRMGAYTGVNRHVSLFGEPTDQLEIGANFSRSLSSGDSVSITAGVTHDDASSSVLPMLPNPSTATRIEATYRRHLAKGTHFPGYHQGMLAAQASVQLAEAQRSALYDSLASQVIELYMAVNITRSRIENTEQAIARSKRLRNYIRKRANLGVSEQKDLLQVDAQLRGLQAESRGLQMLWRNKVVAINRLMGQKPGASFEPGFTRDIMLPKESYDQLIKEAKAHSPALMSVRARVKLAESTIELKRDAKKHQLDLVLFVGNRGNSGEIEVGPDVDQNEMVGGLRLEFNGSADRSGYDADIRQALLDRRIARTDEVRIVQDLEYLLSGLLTEMEAGIEALHAYQQSVKSEQAKLDEAEKRYRAGRTDTDQLIQFEAQLAGAKLNRELQQVELARRYQNLNLLRGLMWQNVDKSHLRMSEDNR